MSHLMAMSCDVVVLHPQALALLLYGYGLIVYSSVLTMMPTEHAMGASKYI